MGTAEILLPYGPLEEVSYYLIPMAKKASVPVVVHLDHGLTYDTCIQALKLGFSSVMYDCSTDLRTLLNDALNTPLEPELSSLPLSNTINSALVSALTMISTSSPTV